MEKSFAGKVVVVTGANSGIGEVAVARFADAGATVYGIVRRKEALESSRAKHPRVKWVLADVSDEKQIAPAIEGIAKEAGRLDVVVNNAAVFFVRPLEQVGIADVRSLLEINVLGTTLVAQAALPALKASRGTIVNISSAAGHKPAAGASVYGATKAAVESLTRSWAVELAPHGVRVNAIAPGPTDTPVFGKAGVPAEMADGLRAAFLKGLPLARIGTPEEVVTWILHVADPSATWMTGQVISIDGGMSLT